MTDLSKPIKYESVVIAACDALPDDIDDTSLVDAVTALVQQRNQARVDATAWEAEARARLDELNDNHRENANNNARENDAARSALVELRGYMQSLDDAGTLTVPRVLGWLDHAIEADQ